ncbi:restriction endonuclease subunit S [Methanobrevibacter smithii]|uniref:restriction endonuclease subunit S n=1 Tax=Methanobrevibacter smithii TaxID=2173 RepID=UPI0037DCDE9B
MSLEFKYYKINDIGEVVSGGTPSTSKNEYWYGDIGWITPKDLSSYDDIYISRGERNISSEGLNNSSAKLVPKNTVLMTSRAPIGYIAIANNELSTNQGFKSLICNEKICHYKYFYYWLKLNIKYIINNSNGSTFKEISGGTFKNLELSLPSLNEQKAISSVLWTIDEKISVLKRINKNLDELCHSLFKYYFIDFIPFCDDDFIDSDIGEIPKEWSITTVGNILDCKLGGTPSRSNESYWGGSIAWINSGKVNDFRIIEPSEYITEKGLKKSATKLLPAKTTVIAITGATLGQISLLEIDSCANQSVIGIIPNINYPYEFVYPLISSILIDLLKHQTGGAQQHINKNNVESFKIICPPAEIISEYKTIVSPIYSKISDNCFEIEKLQKLRDTLLPKLMSGEIDVSKINCDLKIIIRKIYIKSSKLFLWRYLSENQNYIKNTKSNETLLKSRTIYQINKFLAKFNARYRYYRQ